jgi:hypothetical protein
MRTVSRSLFASLSLVAVLASPAFAQLTVTSTTPARHTLTAAPNASIVIDFDRPLNLSTVPPVTASITVFGAYSGVMPGKFTLENANATLRFRPTRSFFAGERVVVSMRDTIQGADASTIQAGGYAYQFAVGSEAAPATFTVIDTIDMRDTPSTSVRVYGGSAHDFNGDDYIDIACINEDVSDFRILLNRADGTGLYHPFLTPTNSVGSTPSPNDAADMNGDGITDVVTCNVIGNSVSIAFGNGDGTFGASATYAMGSGPHGIAVFDADGDGDLDVATANTGSNNVSLRLNNGFGVLFPATTFEGGGNGEYALGTADMNNDGMFDLVVGCFASNQAIVQLSNGNGTFAAQPAQNCGGNAWMLMCGDMNGDGNMDVTMANSFSANGAVLLGNGAGGLAAPQTVAMSSSVVATDLGDIDGDGDLDWVLSDFGGAIWRLFKNNGSGVMTPDQTWPAPSNASCCGFVDIDNDHDIDLTFFDEVADVVILRRNGPSYQETFCYGDGLATPCPCANSGEIGHGCENSFTTGGALLTSSGNAKVSADTLKLWVSNITPASIALFFQGDAQANGGLGSPSGDGILCSSGQIIRLGVRNGSNGLATLGFGNLGDLPIHTGGVVPVGGGTRYYQAWYRNTQAYCTSATYNDSNGLQIVWAP